MKNYIDLMDKIHRKGVFKSSRTGVSTLSLFGEQIRFDLQTGFPLLTTKKIHVKSVLAELLWFLRGDTNVKYLKDQGVSIWDEWADENGDLFDVYGKQFRRWEVPEAAWEIVPIPVPPLEKDVWKSLTTYPSVECELSGRVYGTKACGDFVVLGEGLERNTSGHKSYIVQFYNTGNQVKTCKSVMETGSLRDPFAPMLAGVGYEGDLRGFNTSTVRFKNVRKLWTGIINRCYSPNMSRFKFYGGVGTTVESRWHCLSTFAQDLSTLPGYENWLREPSKFDLDKDLKGGNFYGVDNCVFLPKNVNARIQKQAKAYTLDGKIYPSTRDIASAIGCSRAMVALVAEGVHNSVRFPKLNQVKALAIPEGFMLRPVLFKDQVSQVIESIKINPDSRRHIICLWNVADMEDKNPKAVLPACHIFSQFYVANGKLSCLLTMRSNDVCLGLPFNIASYAFLTHMIAQQTDLEVGELIISFGDVHMYVDHVDGYNIQRQREPRPLPSLKLNKATSIFDYKLEDFVIEMYEPWPNIKYPIAV